MHVVRMVLKHVTALLVATAGLPVAVLESAAISGRFAVMGKIFAA